MGGCESVSGLGWARSKVGCGCEGCAIASLIGGGWLGVAGNGPVLEQAFLNLERGWVPQRRLSWRDAGLWEP